MRIGKLTISDEAYFVGHFICPNCGDTKFGSSEQPDGSLVRHCHGVLDGDEAAPCSFTWPESDDHKYFHLPLEFVIEAKGDI